MKGGWGQNLNPEREIFFHFLIFLLRVHLHEILQKGYRKLREGGLSSGWSFIRVVSRQDGFSSGWSLISVVFNQGGLSSG